MLALLSRIKRYPFPTPREYSALGAATMTGDIEVMELLLAAGADVDIREGDLERTPIFLTTGGGDSAAGPVPGVSSSGGLPELK